jgi:hypothetical protein
MEKLLQEKSYFCKSILGLKFNCKLMSGFNY